MPLNTLFNTVFPYLLCPTPLLILVLLLVYVIIILSVLFVIIITLIILVIYIILVILVILVILIILVRRLRQRYRASRVLTSPPPSHARKVPSHRGAFLTSTSRYFTTFPSSPFVQVGISYQV